MEGFKDKLLLSLQMSFHQTVAQLLSITGQKYGTEDTTSTAVPISSASEAVEHNNQTINKNK